MNGDKKMKCQSGAMKTTLLAIFAIAISASSQLATAEDGKTLYLVRGGAHISDRASHFCLRAGLRFDRKANEKS